MKLLLLVLIFVCLSILFTPLGAAVFMILWWAIGKYYQSN